MSTVLSRLQLQVPGAGSAPPAPALGSSPRKEENGKKRAENKFLRRSSMLASSASSKEADTSPIPTSVCVQTVVGERPEPHSVPSSIRSHSLSGSYSHPQPLPQSQSYSSPSPSHVPRRITVRQFLGGASQRIRAAEESQPTLLNHRLRTGTGNGERLERRSCAELEDLCARAGGDLLERPVYYPPNSTPIPTPTPTTPLTPPPPLPATKSQLPLKTPKGSPSPPHTYIQKRTLSYSS